jgi:predicted permease
VRALPGVEAAGTTDYLPLGGNRSWGTPFPKGVKRPDKGPAGPLVYVVSPGYLQSIGTRLRGRDFSWGDRMNTERAVIIDSGFAKYLAGYAHWPNNDPVGQILSNNGNSSCDHDACMTVVGVADNVHAESVEGENGWQIYYPGTQKSAGTPQLVVRTTLPPAQLATSVMSVLREANPKQTAAEFKPVQSLVDRANSPRRFFLMLVGSFAMLGLVLAALGIYGVISYSVTRQTQEIGIRMALGASAAHVRKQVLVSTMRLAVIGIVVGAGLSIGTSRLLASLLYSTSPWDGVTYCAMAVALLGVAAVAGYVPALRASRVSPLIALRAE